MAGLSTQQQILVEQRVTNEAPSTGVAYLFWLFLGIVSAHRFYLGRPATAVLQILSYFLIVGALWWIIDAFMIPGMIRQKKDEIRRRVQLELLAHGGEAAERPAA